MLNTDFVRIIFTHIFVKKLASNLLGLFHSLAILSSSFGAVTPLLKKDTFAEYGNNFPFQTSKLC